MNYSRWMSKDPDAEPEVIEDEPRRFSLPWPSGSAVAATAMVSLIVLGGAAFVRSIATPEVTTDQAQTVETTTSDQDSGPGAASVDESELNDPTSDYSGSDDSTPDDSTLDDSTLDDSTSDSYASDDSVTGEWSAPAGPPPGPRRLERREFGPPDGVPPGPPMRERRVFRP